MSGSPKVVSIRELEPTRVAWISRHTPLPIQVKELQRLFGQIEVVHISRTFKDAEEVYNEVKKARCEYGVVVLPLSMIAQLVKHKDVTWLWAEMKGLHECEIDKCSEYDPERDTWLPLRGSTKGRHMRFKRFLKIKEVKMVFEEF